MASTRDRRGNKVMSSQSEATRDSRKMEVSGISHLQTTTSRIPGPASRSDGLDSPARNAPKSSLIPPPQVRTNPRVTRQTACNNEPSKTESVSPGTSKQDQELELSDVNLPTSFSPASTLTRHGAFRYGRGVKPLEVLNIRSGATTLPRMRPKKRSDVRNLDIFTSPEVLDSSETDNVKEITQNKEVEQCKLPAGKTLQRPHTLGRMAGIRHKSQESGIPRKQGTGQATTGRKISKAIKGGGDTSKETDSSRNIRSPNESSNTQCANKDVPKEHKQQKDTCHSARPSSSKETSNPRSRGGLVKPSKVDSQSIGISPKAPLRRNGTGSPSTNALSSKRTPSSITTKGPRETSSKSDQVNGDDTPKPPPRRLKSHSKTTPTNTPRSESLRHRLSSGISARNSVASTSKIRLAHKSSLSFPQSTKPPNPTQADTDRQRSQSVSQIPVHISRRSSVPYRQVKLRPKKAKSDRPAIFRLSLDGVDSGTECSSSLATTPSECSIDIDSSIENGSSICQNTPSRFYLISGVEKETQDDTSSESSEKVPQPALEDSLTKINENSKTCPSSSKSQSISLLQEGTSCLNEDKSPSDSILTTPQNEETTATTSKSKMDTINSENIPTTLNKDTNSVTHRNSANLLKTADLTTSAGEIRTTRTEVVGDSSGSDLNDAGSNFVNTSETKMLDQNRHGRTAEKPKMVAPSEAFKTRTYNQSRIGREIALKVARGDLKATVVDDENDAGDSTSEEPAMRQGTAEHDEASTSDQADQSIGDKVISGDQFPSEDSWTRENISRISGPGILEKMMDKEDAIPRPNHKKSFHPYTKEKSEVEQRYLNSCSDPLKLLEFLMNVDDPPKVRGYRGERGQVEEVKRRTKSDVQSPRLQSEMGAERSETNRWSMPSALEQWSQNFWAHFTSNRRSQPNSCTKEKNALPLNRGSGNGESVTAGMPNEAQKTNVVLRKPDDINDARGGLLSVGTKADSERSLQQHRWSIPLQTGYIPPSSGCPKVAEPTELSQATAAVNKTPDTGRSLKRKSKWRWSFPLPLQRTLRSTECLLDDPAKHHSGSQISKLTQANKEPAKSTTKPDLMKERRAPSFSDIVDSGTTSSKPVKVFIDSSYAKQNNGFHSSELTATDSATSHLNSNSIGPVSTNDSAAISLKTEMARCTESAGSSVVLRNRDSSSSGRQIKKRLSWKRERSLETVCYLERQDSSEALLTHEGFASEKDCSQSDSPSPLSSLEHLPKDHLKDDEDFLDPSDDLQANCRPDPVPVYSHSQWVLPPDELKSKLESVYAEQQKEESFKDEKEGGSYHLEIPAPESDVRLSLRGDSSYPPSESIMHDLVPAMGGIGKRFSLKQQQLSVSPDSDLNRLSQETQGSRSRDSLRETHSASRSPVGDGVSVYDSRSKLNRPRSSSGPESTKDTRRKLDDVGHKTRLRIERDRETKTSISPPNPGCNVGPETTTPNTIQIRQRLIPPVETRLNDQPLRENDGPADGSMKAFRRRKKSMAIAFSEGLLDLQEDQSTSVEKTSELQVVSQISQLNQELMQLTERSPPRTPPTPGYSFKGNLFRSPSRGSLTSLPGSSALSLKSILPRTRHWNSVGQFQIGLEYPTSSAPDSSAGEPVVTQSEKSTGLPQTKKTQPKIQVKEDEESVKEKAVSAKVLLSRIRLWSKKTKPSKTKPRPEIVKLDPERPLEEAGRSLKVEEDNSQSTGNVSPVSFTDAVGLQISTPDIPHHLINLHPVPMSKDTALRQTWHGTPSRKPGEDFNEDGTDDLLRGRSNFKRCNSLRNPIRQRKRGLSPMENAHLVALQISRETLPGSSVDSGIVKDRGTEEVCLAGDSDNSGSTLCSPCSSISGSNPPSRPLSSDISDMQWEKGADTEAVNGVNIEDRKLSAVTLGRREFGTTATKSRRPLLTRLSFDSQAAMQATDALISPKKVTFSLAEDIAKKAAEEDLRRLPKPLHLPRRIKTDPSDMKSVAGLVLEMDNTDTSNQARSYLRRRAQSELSSIREKNWDSIITHPPIITEDVEKATPTLTRPKSIPDHLSLLENQDIETPPKKNSLADLIGSEVGEVLTTFGSQYNFEAYSPDTMPTFAEALWDHVTMDESELAFKAGDVIEVTDMRDKNWWWGCTGEVEGWVPAQFVRLRVSQGETVEECMERLKEEREQSRNQTVTKRNRKVSLSFLSNEQVRSRVVEEIITTERDYVHHLRDVCEGYLSQARDRPEMFSGEVVESLFGNIEEIYSFQKGFLLQLEATIVKDKPQLSRIGSCFLEHRRGFQTYSEYCNNYPNALRDLKLLREKQKYDQFFEACRLLQNMIEINLEGFLLTPVQKICKYPLQLRELVKYTRPGHADYQELCDALEVMKDVAVTINDRKRRIENIDKIAAWQKSVNDWEGEDLLNRSTQLIHTGDINMLAGKRWTTGRRLFLFDRQLVICKKDWKGTLLYKKRINLDTSKISDMPDGKDQQWNVTVKHAFTIQDSKQNKIYIFSCKGGKDKKEWLRMFAKERESVMKDEETGFIISATMCEAAMKNVTGGDLQPSKPQNLAGVTRKVSTMPYAYQHKILESSSKKVPLPKGISSTDVFKKKRGLFGIGKK